MTTKWEINRAVRASALPPPSRLIMLTLSDIADVGTAEIPERHTPSLRVLAEETGLGEATVKRHLTSLEDGGWIERTRPTQEAARSKGERTRYQLAVPDGSQGAQLGSGRAQSIAQPEPTPGLTVSPPRAQPEPTQGSERAHSGLTVSPIYKEDDLNDRDDLNDQSSAQIPVLPKPRPALAPVGSTRPPIARFDELWPIYPLHDGETEARRAWVNAIKRATPDEIIAGAIRYRDWPRRDPNFTKKLANWLANDCWKDPMVAAVPPANRVMPGTQQLTEVNGLMLGPRNIANLDRAQRMAALDQQRNTQQTAIEGGKP